MASSKLSMPRNYLAKFVAKIFFGYETGYKDRFLGENGTLNYVILNKENVSFGA